MQNKELNKKIKKHKIICAILIVISLVVLILSILYIKSRIISIDSPATNILEIATP